MISGRNPTAVGREEERQQRKEKKTSARPLRHLCLSLFFPFVLDLFFFLLYGASMSTVAVLRTEPPVFTILLHGMYR